MGQKPKNINLNPAPQKSDAINPTPQAHQALPHARVDQITGPKHVLDSSPMRNTCFTTSPPSPLRDSSPESPAFTVESPEKNPAPRTQRPSRNLLHLPENQGATKLRPQTHQTLNQADQLEHPRRSSNHRSTLPEKQSSTIDPRTTNMESQIESRLSKERTKAQIGNREKPAKTVLSEPPLPGSESRRIRCWRSHRSSEPKADDDGVEKSPPPRNQPDRNKVRITSAEVHLILPLCRIEKRGQS